MNLTVYFKNKAVKPKSLLSFFRKHALTQNQRTVRSKIQPLHKGV
jgi:hypothetical protein